jgi:hypothetical protein
VALAYQSNGHDNAVFLAVEWARVEERTVREALRQLPHWIPGQGDKGTRQGDKGKVSSRRSSRRSSSRSSRRTMGDSVEEQKAQ